MTSNNLASLHFRRGSRGSVAMAAPADTVSGLMAMLPGAGLRRLQRFVETVLLHEDPARRGEGSGHNLSSTRYL